MKVVERTSKELTNGILSTSQFKIVQNSKMFNILSNNIYTNKIFAPVRELIANAIDANKGSHSPVVVHCPSENKLWFSVRDYGPGMSKEFIEKLYTTYGYSSKSDSDEYIGCMGIGSKSPFAYTTRFSIISYHNNMAYMYSAAINEHGTPTLRLLAENPTNNESGVMIKYDVDENDIADINKCAVLMRKCINNENETRIVLENGSAQYTKFGEKTISDGIRLFTDYNGNCEFLTFTMGGIPYNVNRNDLYNYNIFNNNNNICGSLVALGNHNNQSGIILDFPIGIADVDASRENLIVNEQFAKALYNKLDFIVKYAESNINKILSDESISINDRVKIIYNMIKTNNFMELVFNDPIFKNRVYFSSYFKEKISIHFAPITIDAVNNLIVTKCIKKCQDNIPLQKKTSIRNAAVDSYTNSITLERGCNKYGIFEYETRETVSSLYLYSMLYKLLRQYGTTNICRKEKLIAVDFKSLKYIKLPENQKALYDLYNSFDNTFYTDDKFLFINIGSPIHEALVAMDYEFKTYEIVKPVNTKKISTSTSISNCRKLLPYPRFLFSSYVYNILDNKTRVTSAISDIRQFTTDNDSTTEANNILTGDTIYYFAEYSSEKYKNNPYRYIADTIISFLNNEYRVSTKAYTSFSNNNLCVLAYYALKYYVKTINSIVCVKRGCMVQFEELAKKRKQKIVCIDKDFITKNICERIKSMKSPNWDKIPMWKIVNAKSVLGCNGTINTPNIDRLVTLISFMDEHSLIKFNNYKKLLYYAFLRCPWVNFEYNSDKTDINGIQFWYRVANPTLLKHIKNVFKNDISIMRKYNNCSVDDITADDLNFIFVYYRDIISRLTWDDYRIESYINNLTDKTMSDKIVEKLYNLNKCDEIAQKFKQISYLEICDKYSLEECITSIKRLVPLCDGDERTKKIVDKFYKIAFDDMKDVIEDVYKIINDKLNA